MAYLRHLFFSQTGHFHGGVGVITVRLPGAGNFWFALEHTFVATFLPGWIPFCSSCCAMVVSASPCCGTRCASTRTNVSASDVSPACKI